jgi:hypothetical protein
MQMTEYIKKLCGASRRQLRIGMYLPQDCSLSVDGEEIDCFPLWMPGNFELSNVPMSEVGIVVCC